MEWEPYSVEESERAAGKGSYQTPKRRKIESQKTDKDEDLEKSEENAMSD